jgi:hypothetical protein
MACCFAGVLNHRPFIGPVLLEAGMKPNELTGAALNWAAYDSQEAGRKFWIAVLQHIYQLKGN